MSDRLEQGDPNNTCYALTKKNPHSDNRVIFFDIPSLGNLRVASFTCCSRSWSEVLNFLKGPRIACIDCRLTLSIWYIDYFNALLE